MCPSHVAEPQGVRRTPSAEGGDRVGVAHSYLTPDAQWHTIWRTLANRGE
ncbi:hypothetical protein EDD94_4627 [Streptomyces sp. PanSC9]|nr:hypothetical protein EDD94_4627 [Streptomyces sp. PanSC9]